jgi:hypothetical protein
LSPSSCPKLSVRHCIEEDEDKHYNDELTALAKEDEDKQCNDELTALGKEDGDKHYNDELTALAQSCQFVIVVFVSIFLPKAVRSSLHWLSSSSLPKAVSSSL